MYFKGLIKGHYRYLNICNLAHLNGHFFLPCVDCGKTVIVDCHHLICVFFVNDKAHHYTLYHIHFLLIDRNYVCSNVLLGVSIIEFERIDAVKILIIDHKVQNVSLVPNLCCFILRKKIFICNLKSRYTCVVVFFQRRMDSDLADLLMIYSYRAEYIIF